MNKEMNSVELENSTEEQAINVPKKKKKLPKVLLSLILIIILVFVGLIFISKYTNFDVLGIKKDTEKIVKASDWQAVFLTNGQVYFGKLKDVNGNYPTLEDVYYLQVQEVPIQPAEPATDEEGVQPAQQTQQQMILVKFGTELHKPMDKMYINKDHMLMYEDLAEDSGVVKAIDGYKEAQENKE